MTCVFRHRRWRFRFGGSRFMPLCRIPFLGELFTVRWVTIPSNIVEQLQDEVTPPSRHLRAERLSTGWSQTNTTPENGSRPAIVDRSSIYWHSTSWPGASLESLVWRPARVRQQTPGRVTVESR